MLNAALIADAAHDNKDAAQLYAAVNVGQPSLRMAEMLASWEARQGQMSQADAELALLGQVHPDLAIALPALQAQVAKPVISTPTQGMAEACVTLAGALTQPQQRFLRVTFLRFALQLRPDFTAARLLLASTQASAADPSAQPTTGRWKTRWQPCSRWRRRCALRPGGLAAGQPVGSPGPRQRRPCRGWTG